MSISNRLLALVISSLCLAGCQTAPQAPQEPQILSLNYVLLNVPAGINTESKFIEAFELGTRQLSELDAILSYPYQNTDLAIEVVCNFTADFSLGTFDDPSLESLIDSSGTPGQPGFNIVITVGRRNITTDNPPSCIDLDRFVLDIGSRSDVVEVGVPTSRGNARVILVDGRAFEADAFFEARLQSFDPANERSHGAFRFIHRLNATTVLLGDGSYALTP